MVSPDGLGGRDRRHRPRTPAGHRDPVVGDRNGTKWVSAIFSQVMPVARRPQSYLRVISRRCQANGVAGVTAKTSLHRCWGISLDSAASHSRSPGW